MDNLGESIAAIVVTYNPDEVVLNQLLASLSMQVDRVFVVDNGSSNLKKMIAEIFLGYLW
ncbi:hypothetical protein [Vibrio sp. Hal054]|uniref:hypothetical protein n=1 Tax=Vibrio sp. Hal054 TaxID=3035158 RepID=UPI00301B8687